MTIDQDLPFELAAKVEGELAEGERLQWAAQPAPMRSVARSIPIVAFGVAWTAFAVFWTCAASGALFDHGAQGGLFWLFGIPFIVIGLGMLSAPLWALRKAKRTVYAVTDRRAFILDSAMGTRIRSFGPEGLGDLERIERADGSGDIVIVREYYHSHEGGRSAHKIGFFGIADVRGVEQMLRALASPRS
jgi:hypothetical protein